MIGYIQGNLLLCESLGYADEIIVLTSGIGYQLLIPTGIISCSINQSLSLWVFSVTRDDGTRLYGFIERGTIRLFSQLLNISGVGAKAAIALLSVHGDSELSRLIVAGNVVALTQAEGIGKKIAQRIINEMQTKLHNLSYLSPTNNTNDSTSRTMHDHTANAVSALCNLGYSLPQAQQAVQSANTEMITDHHGLEHLISASLRFLIQS